VQDFTCAIGRAPNPEPGFGHPVSIRIGLLTPAAAQLLELVRDLDACYKGE
jgi:hypothetical protein